MKYVIIASVMFLTACSEISRELDEKIVCDPDTNKAYIVKSVMGDAMKVYRIRSADVVCK